MVDYFQNSISSPDVASPGLVVQEALAEIDSTMAVEDATAIGLGVVVSRGTDKDAQVTLGGSTLADVFGITCRVANAVGALGSESTNLPTYAQYTNVPVIRKGYVWVYCTGTGNAGSRNINYNATTGAIDLGTAGGGEIQLHGVELCNTISSSGSYALLRLIDFRAEPYCVTSITMNSQAAETRTAGVVNLVVVEAITINGQAAETNTAGTVDLTVVESIDDDSAGSPISGAVVIEGGANITVTTASQTITVAYTA